MKKGNGFSLIEVMIALACMVGALSVTIVFSMKLYRSWKNTAKTMHTQLALHAALSSLRRDLEHAPRDARQWYTTGPHELIWHNKLLSCDMRICVVKNRLERFEGSFNKQTQQWHTRLTSVLAQNISTLQVRLHRGNNLHLKAAEIDLVASDGKQEKALIALGCSAGERL